MWILSSENGLHLKGWFISIHEIILYVGGAKNGLLVMIISQSYLFEKTGFFNDLFLKTKIFRAY